MKVSAIVPVHGKQEMTLSMLRCLRKSEPNLNRLEIIAVVEEDHDTAVAIEKQGIVNSLIEKHEHHGPVYGWNEGAKIATGDAFALMATDVWFLNDWRREALKKLKELNWNGVVGFNNCSGLGGQSTFAEHFLASRSFCMDVMGGVFVCPHYTHWYIDIEEYYRALKGGKYLYAENALVEHRHWRYKKANREDYAITCGCKQGEEKQIFDRRKEQGWPIDYEAILT